MRVGAERIRAGWVATEWVATEWIGASRIRTGGRPNPELPRHPLDTDQRTLSTYAWRKRECLSGLTDENPPRPETVDDKPREGIGRRSNTGDIGSVHQDQEPEHPAPDAGDRCTDRTRRGTSVRNWAKRRKYHHLYILLGLAAI